MSNTLATGAPGYLTSAEIARQHPIPGGMKGGEMSYEEDLKQERKNLLRFKAAAKKLAQASIPVWNFGDGIGGFVREYLDESFIEAGLKITESPSGFNKKQKIPNSLRTKVFERDEYRCVYCGTHMDLCADHRHPESKGGETTIENMQTLCRSCNVKKGTKPDRELEKL